MCGGFFGGMAPFMFTGGLLGPLAFLALIIVGSVLAFSHGRHRR